MPDLPDVEQQLRTIADRLDASVAPVRADEVMVAEMTPSSRRRAPAGGGRAVAALVALAVVAAAIVVVARHHTNGAPTPAHATTTTHPPRYRNPTRIVASLTIPFDQPPIVAVFTNAPAWKSFWSPARAPAVNFLTEFAVVIDSGDCSTFKGVDFVGYPTGSVSVGLGDQLFGCHRGPDGLQVNRMAEAIERRGFARTLTVGGPSLPAPFPVDLTNTSGYVRANLHGGGLLHVPCLFAHTNLYTLRQPITITFPGRAPVPIVSGDRLSPANAVTLDADFSTDPGNPGYAQGAPTALEGATTPGGPFEHIDQLRPGQLITMAQDAAGGGCVQRWRVFAQLGAGLGPARGVPGPLELLLEGFVPRGDTSTYVDAVPAN